MKVRNSIESKARLAIPVLTPPRGLSAGFKIAANENLGWVLEDKKTYHLLWVVMVKVE